MPMKKPKDPRTLGRTGCRVSVLLPCGPLLPPSVLLLHLPTSVKTCLLYHCARLPLCLPFLTIPPAPIPCPPPHSPLLQGGALEVLESFFAALAAASGQVRKGA